MSVVMCHDNIMRSETENNARSDADRNEESRDVYLPPSDMMPMRLFAQVTT